MVSELNGRGEATAFRDRPPRPVGNLDARHHTRAVDWIDGGLNGAAEERATLCDLRIYVSDQNACRFVDFVSNEDAEPLIVPAVHLAEGLATDWWRIFGGRDREHRIQRYRTGFALPDLSFRADGSMFAVTGRSFYSQNPHLRFPFAGEETLPRGAAESTLSRFIEKVVDRLAGEGARSSEVALCWSRVAESRSDPDEQAFCEASGALGLDPYAISEDDARFIERASRVFSQEPLIEFLAGLTRKERPASVPDFVDQVESRPAEQSILPELDHVASQIAHLTRYHGDDHPWAVGYRAARAVRDTRRSVINDLHHAERQATGRAFAAEFLAPVESVVEMCEAGSDAEEIADEFDVSSYVIEDQIRNQNRVRGACDTLN